MKVGDLVKTVYDPRWGIIIKAWRIYIPNPQWAVEFVYPDSTKSTQPEYRIREVSEVISESR